MSKKCVVYSVCKCYDVSFENVYCFLMATKYRIMKLILLILSIGSASFYSIKEKGS